MNISLLNDLKKNIYLRLKDNKYITDSDLKRIYTNDDARLFYSTATTKEEFLAKNVYISTQEELNQLLIIDQMIMMIKSSIMIESQDDGILAEFDLLIVSQFIIYYTF